MMNANNTGNNVVIAIVVLVAISLLAAAVRTWLRARDEKMRRQILAEIEESDTSSSQAQEQRAAKEAERLRESENFANQRIDSDRRRLNAIFAMTGVKRRWEAIQAFSSESRDAEIIGRYDKLQESIFDEYWNLLLDEARKGSSESFLVLRDLYREWEYPITQTLPEDWNSLLARHVEDIEFDDIDVPGDLEVKDIRRMINEAIVANDHLRARIALVLYECYEDEVNELATEVYKQQTTDALKALVEQIKP